MTSKLANQRAKSTIYLCGIYAVYNLEGWRINTVERFMKVLEEYKRILRRRQKITRVDKESSEEESTSKKTGYQSIFKEGGMKSEDFN